MKRSELKYKKRLIGIYKRCIDATSFQPRTKSFRDRVSLVIHNITL